jgi:hypothetical protein
MNFSMFTCNRNTHLKIAAVALAAAIVAIVGIHARSGDAGRVTAGAKTSGIVVKAGKPAVYVIGITASSAPQSRRTATKAGP